MAALDPERTTSAGMWRYASEFAGAANELDDSHQREIFIPLYYMYGHAIELALKAFLLTKGVTLEELRSRKLGHDLKALLDRCVGLDLNALVPLSQLDGEILTLLNYEYSAKRFEYIETGTMSLPERRLLRDLVARLIGGLEKHCVQYTLQNR